MKMKLQFIKTTEEGDLYRNLTTDSYVLLSNQPRKKTELEKLEDEKEKLLKKYLKTKISTKIFNEIYEIGYKIGYIQGIEDEINENYGSI